MKIRKWTAENVNMLKKLAQENLSYVGIQQRMHNFSISALRSKASELNIKISSRHKWTTENLEELKAMAKNGHSYKEISAKLGISIEKVICKASKEKINIKNTIFWEKNEIDVLTKMFKNEKSLNHISETLGRSISSIKQKLYKLNLKNEKSLLLEEQKKLKKQGLRKCKVCKEIKNAVDNFIKSSSKNYFRSTCKSCCKLDNKKQWEKQKKNMTIIDLFRHRSRGLWSRAKKKNIPINVNEYDLLEIYEKQNGKCFYSGICMDITPQSYRRNFFSVSVDRVNPDLGYVKDNIVLCCDCVNTMKNTMDLKQFADICSLIHKNSKNFIKNKDEIAYKPI